MSSHIIIVENPKDWPASFPEANIVMARDYLLDPGKHKTKGIRIINFCRGYRYLSTGYYCSLLAEARRHKIIPSVRTITDISSKAIYSLNIEDIDEIIQKVLRKRTKSAPTENFEVLVCFGQSEDKELQELARQLFELFPAPLLKVEFKHHHRWLLTSLRTVQTNVIKPDQLEFFTSSYHTYISSRWRQRKARSQARYDIAILHDPKEKLPPSNSGALKRFIEAGKKVDAEVELITRKDFNRLAEYDALLIRETTNINHHTYRFATKAETEGMAVIDDPDSIVRCTNKVYLAELLTTHKIPTPRTVILRKGEKVDIEAMVGFPAVLKIPDGSFSRGVFKAQSIKEYSEITERLFRESDLILAQEYLYTDFDWRIGILNNKVLFACKYLMSPSHWQIVKHDSKGRAIEGGFVNLPLDEVPENIIQAATGAAALIGNGFYGVDLKERNGKVYVIEVNDNPNLDSGVEDKLLGNEIYRIILEELVRRVESRRVN